MSSNQGSFDSRFPAARCHRTRGGFRGASELSRSAAVSHPGGGGLRPRSEPPRWSRRRCSKLKPVTVPFFSGADVERAVSPHEAYDAVKGAFIAHAQGTWTMQPKVYVSGSEHGDFRAMES